MMAEEAADEAERAGSRLEEGGLPPGKQRKGAIPWAWVWPLVVLPLLVVVLMAFQNKGGATVVMRRLSGSQTYLKGVILRRAINTTLVNITLTAIREQVQEVELVVAELHSGLAAVQEGEKVAEQRWEEMQGAAKELHAGLQTLSNATAQVQEEPGSAMVIVEPRQPAQLQRVLENYDSNIPLNWDLYIFHGKSAGEFVKKAAANVALHRQVVYVPLGVDEGSKDTFSQLLKSVPDFWGKINAERVLVFQTDSVLCSASPRKISDFEHLAYIGCGYGKAAGGNSTAPEKEWKGAPYWGNSGVAFHQKSKALECLARPFAKEEREDVIFSRCVSEGLGRHAESGAHLSEFCTTISSQTTLTARSFAAHRGSEPMDERSGISLFEDFCPEIKMIMA